MTRTSGATRTGWSLILGAGLAGDGPAILRYRSADLLDWEYAGIVCTGDEGQAWECPQLFPLGDRHVLLVSQWDDRRRPQTEHALAMVGDLRRRALRRRVDRALRPRPGLLRARDDARRERPPPRAGLGLGGAGRAGDRSPGLGRRPDPAPCPDAAGRRDARHRAGAGARSAPGCARVARPAAARVRSGAAPRHGAGTPSSCGLDGRHPRPTRSWSSSCARRPAARRRR